MIPSWDMMNFVVFFIEAIILIKYLEAQLITKYTYGSNPLYAVTIALMGFLLKQIDSMGIFIFYIGVFTLIHFTYLNTIQEKLVHLGTFLLLNIAIENMVILFFVSKLNIPIAEIVKVSFISFGAIVTAKMILFFVITYLIHKRSNKLYPLSITANKSIIIKIVKFIIIINFILILILNIYKTIPVETNNYLYLLLLSSAIICFLSVSIYEGIIKESEKQIKLNLLLQQKETEYKYNQEIAVTVEGIRAVKHDISNHLSAISAYIQCKDYDKAEQYIQRVLEPIESMNNLLHVNNSLIASILYVKNVVAEKSGIIFEISTDFYDEIFIEDLDLTILLGNILDNAIEACERVKAKEKRIKLSLGSKRNYFYIDCANPVDHEKIQYKDKQFLTTKEDPLHHGIGLKNIQRVVDKYEGDKEISVTENEFEIKVTLKNQK